MTLQFGRPTAPSAAKPSVQRPSPSDALRAFGAPIHAQLNAHQSMEVPQIAEKFNHPGASAGRPVMPDRTAVAGTVNPHARFETYNDNNAAELVQNNTLRELGGLRPRVAQQHAAVNGAVRQQFVHNLNP